MGSQTSSSCAISVHKFNALHERAGLLATVFAMNLQKCRSECVQSDIGKCC